MKILILSGVGGSSNWVPFILPLVCIVVMLYSIDLLIRFIKKRRLHHEDNLMHDTTAPGDNNDLDEI